MKNNHVLYAILLSLISYSTYSFGDATGKYLGMQGFSPFQIAFTYSSIAAICLLIFSSRLGGARSVFRTQNRKLHLLRGSLFAPTQALNYFAFSKLPMANVYTVLFMTPFLTTILAHYFLNERTSLKTWTCILFGFAGVLVVNRPDLHQISWPLLACTASAFMGASRNVVARKMGYEETAFSLSIIPCLCIMLVSAVPALSSEAHFTLTSVLLFIMGGIFFACGTLFISLSLLQKVNLSLLTPFHYSQIIWGILFGILLFSNMPDLYTWIGSVLIIISGIALIYTKDKPPAQPA